jgi:hypothetical protein
MGTREEQSERSATSRRQVIVGAGAIAFTATQMPKLVWAAEPPLPTAAQFQGTIGSGFLVSGDDVTLSLILVDVDVPTRDNRPAELPQPFSLIFRSAPDAPALTGQIYQVQHSGLGSMSMFLSPISPDPSYYEAAFN